jgi:preprotein translocase subunit YajC
MFIGDAFAQDTSASAAATTATVAAPAGAAGAPLQEPSPIAGLLPLLLIAVIFYFFMIRPQSKRYKEHQAMVSALARGDKVVTNGGLFGKVTKVDTDTVHVEIAEGVVVQLERMAIARAVDKHGAPKKADNDTAAAAPAAKATKGGKKPKVANDN